MRSLNNDNTLWNAEKPGNNSPSILEGPFCCWYYTCCWYWDINAAPQPGIRTI